jgi:peptidoglycan/xylan/chitin deacetylase (PgdA/CDA1 family)
VIVPAAVGLAVIGSAAHGAFHRNSPVFGSALGELPGTGKRVALTFDDGPNPEATPRILDALSEHGVKATFFILGAHAERWPDLVRRVALEGHQVGNHGYFHRKLHFKSPSYVKRDITLGRKAIERAGGVTPQFFRAPHGFRSPWVNSIAHSLGERTIGWSLGVWDSDRPGVDAIVKRTLEGTRAGSIVLLHDGDGYNANGDRLQTAQALPRIISGLRDRGFEFVTLPAQ